MKRCAIILVVMISITSCSMRRMATTMTAGIVGDGMKAVESEQDLWIAKQSIIPLVKVLEVLNEGDPGNPEFLGLMAKVYGNVAFGFFEPKYLAGKDKEVWRGRVERFYQKGYQAGTVSLEDRFGKGVSGPVMDFESAISGAKEKDLSVLFWTAFDLGNWVNLYRGDVTKVALLPKVTAMVDRVVAVDPSFGFGSAKAFQAAMLASRPKMLGGNPEKARGIFEEAIAMTDGKYLMSKVMFAEWYAIPMKDAALKKRLLTEVIDADPMALPEQVLANKLAQERARLLLGR